MALLGLAFFLSGAAALVYQVVWQRILTLHTGVGVVSMALIVASFMAGLGIGSELGGLLEQPAARRRRPCGRSRSSSSRVGLFASLSCRLYHDGLGRYADALYATTAGAALAHFLAFLLPTTLMGMSLPFLVRATVRETASAARVIGALYGLNVLGAATGALARPVAAGALPRDGGRGARGRPRQPARPRPRARRRPPWSARRRERGEPAEPGAPVTARASGPLRLWLLLYGLSGLHRALVRDRVVPADGRGRQEHGLHLRHGARALPARPRRRQPGRRSRIAPRLARPLEAFLDLQLLLLASAGAVARPRRAPAADERPSTAASSTTGARRLSSTWGRTGTAADARGALRPAAAHALRAADARDGALVRRAAARGPGRPAHERPQGRACCRPRTSSAARRAAS